MLIDYDGMNHYAAKVLGFKHPIAKDEIFINRDTLTRRETIQTIVHEIVEANHMKEDNIIYWDAHELAAKAEKDPKNIAEITTFLLKKKFCEV